MRYLPLLAFAFLFCQNIGPQLEKSGGSELAVAPLEEINQQPEPTKITFETIAKAMNYDIMAHETTYKEPITGLVATNRVELAAMYQYYIDLLESALRPYVEQGIFSESEIEDRIPTIPVIDFEQKVAIAAAALGCYVRTSILSISKLENTITISASRTLTSPMCYGSGNAYHLVVIDRHHAEGAMIEFTFINPRLVDPVVFLSEE